LKSERARALEVCPAVAQPAAYRSVGPPRAGREAGHGEVGGGCVAFGWGALPTIGLARGETETVNGLILPIGPAATAPAAAPAATVAATATATAAVVVAAAAAAAEVTGAVVEAATTATASTEATTVARATEATAAAARTARTTTVLGDVHSALHEGRRKP
jgi:hypothetical protein